MLSPVSPSQLSTTKSQFLILIIHSICPKVRDCVIHSCVPKYVLTISMMIGTQQPHEHKENFLQKILDRHHHGHGNEDKATEDKPQHTEGGIHDELKKDEEGMKKYLKEDEELEQEGQTYGGLM